RFRHDPDDPRSLNHDNVAAILEDRNGVLWVGTRGGLNRLDRSRGGFERFEHDPQDPTTISNNWARALHEDSRGRFWVGTHGGLNLFDRNDGTFTRFTHDPDDPTSLIEGRVSAIHEDDDGRLWVGTGRTTGGLNVLDVEEGTVRRYRFDASASDWPADPRPSGPWTGGGVTAIEQDVDGTLWFANWEGWVTGFDPSTNRAVNYNVRELTEAPEAHPFTIFQSDDGTLWFGSVYGPLLRSASP
ncbi:MAG: two-component regulator propeller domain-containing protein, partial [Rhodothermales bacterium]